MMIIFAAMPLRFDAATLMLRLMPDTRYTAYFRYCHKMILRHAATLRGDARMILRAARCGDAADRYSAREKGHVRVGQP